MLIRSGLIQNYDHIEVGAFSVHWLEVHGPLAAKLPNLRGYVQNHVATRGETPLGRLHRIDGISQLWFDDIDAMTHGMESPENKKCIADISGFLSRVTLAIQTPGMWVGSAFKSASGSKIMAVYAGEERDFPEVETGIAQAFADSAGSASYRINRIVTGKFIVDPSIARSESPLLAILEAYFADDGARSQFLDADRLIRGSGLAPTAVFAVTPHVFIAPPE